MINARRVGLVAILILTMILIPPSATAITPVGQRIYVDINAVGAKTGVSWVDAFTSLQDALSAAVYGDTIWMADGVYYPDVGVGLADNNRGHSFQIKEGVQVYGGFAGGETALSERDWVNHRTILSGDIDQNDTTDGAGLVLSSGWITGTNSYTVVRFNSTTNAAVLDGFYITGGAAMGSGCPADNGCGGGILVYSADNYMFAGPVIRNVYISGNKALVSGGGMAVWNGTSMLMSNVTLTGNRADKGGGLGLLRYGWVTIEGASVLSNSASYGAGIYDTDRGRLILSNATVSENTATMKGGGLYTFFDTIDGGVPATELTDVVFSSNVANSGGTSQGGGIAHIGGGPLTMTRVSFQDNMAGLDGGGICISNTTRGTSIVSMTNMTFTGNYTGGRGGGLFMDSGTLTVTNASFAGNWTSGVNNYGGGAGINNGSAVFSHTDFISNSSYFGGGLRNVSGAVKVNNANIISNTANFGGGIATFEGIGSTIVTNALLQDNTASALGGGFYHAGGALTMANVTFLRNHASQYGGGLLFQQPVNKPMSVTNSIFEGNLASHGGAISGWNNGSGIIENTLLVGNRATGYGGAVDLHLYDGSVLTITAATIISNTAGNYGAIMDNGIGNTNLKPVYLRNSIVWGNNPVSQPISTTATGRLSVNYSDIQGGWTGDGANNIDADPQVLAAAYPGGDGIWHTADDDYGNMHLRLGSPAVNAGNNAYTTLAVDLDGLPRIFGPTVDMGAYELQTSNQAPLADAGPDHSAAVNALVMLDGSAWGDPDGNLPLSYHWQQTGGPVVELSDASVVTPTFTAPSYSTVLTFTLTVTDALGLPSLAPDEVVITITNQAPTANAGPDQRVKPRALVTLDGSGSSDPDGGLPLSYSWQQVGGPPVDLSDSEAAMPTFTAPGYTTVLTYTLTVIDTGGLASAPDEVVITVEPFQLFIPLTLK
ncbi:MAG: PKD domain-containing protein [Anaerolineae bacterium]